MKVAMVLDNREINNLQSPVVVEMWHHAVGRQASGSKRRQFHAEFTKAERRRGRKLYNIFYRWFLVTGTPQQLIVSPPIKADKREVPYSKFHPEPGARLEVMSMRDFSLTKKLVAFFGGI